MTRYSFSLVNDLDTCVEGYIAHQKSQFSPRRVVNIFSVLLICSTVVVAGRTLLTSNFDWIYLLIAAAIAAFLTAFIVASQRLVGRKAVRGQMQSHWDESERQGKITSYEFDDDSLTIIDDEMGGEFAWSDLHDWRDDERFLLIYLSECFFYYIEKADLNSDTLRALRTRLETAMPKGDE